MQPDILPNWKMIDHVLEAIKEDETSFWMGAWFKHGYCKTTKCLAGWALELTGHSLMWSDGAGEGMQHGIYVDGKWAEPIGSQNDIVGLTAQELNISYAQANHICYSTDCKTVEELEERILEILGPRPLDQ